MMTDATWFYYSLTKNSYLDVVKIAMWTAKDMGCDSLCIPLMQTHDEQILNDLKFEPLAVPTNWYMVNYSFGER